MKKAIKWILIGFLLIVVLFAAFIVEMVMEMVDVALIINIDPPLLTLLK